MSYARAFIDGMRSAFDLAPKQKRHKANFITQDSTLRVDVEISNTTVASAWVAVGAHMHNAGDSYVSKCSNTEKAALSARQQ